MVMECVFAILNLSGQDQLHRDVCHPSFDLLDIIVLPSRKHFFRAEKLHNRQAQFRVVGFPSGVSGSCTTS